MNYNVSQDYLSQDGSFSSSPSWCIAIYRLGNPVSYSRVNKGSFGPVIGGALLRKETPLIITSDCISLNISGAKTSCVKSLSATLKGDTNYLSANAVLPGDWLIAWMHTNLQDTQAIVSKLMDGKAANDFKSGLKFVGRVHSIRRSRHTTANGVKLVTYALQGTGFSELSTVFFYDTALATVESKEDVWQFFAQIGLDAFKWLSEGKKSSGQIQDNAEEFFEKFLDIVVGTGVARKIHAGREIVAKDVIGGSIEGGKVVADGSNLLQSPQHNREAPYAYLTPLSVAVTLGRTVIDSRKGTDNGHQSFGYADILTTLSGVQKYGEPGEDTPHKGFVPIIKDPDDGPFVDIHTSRLRCSERIKGTYIPIEPSFINKPLWELLNEFKNPTINEMYTCIRPDLAGNLMPTLVFRQIPFSTNAAIESSDMPLTRFLSMPRWVIPGEIVVHDDFGRSDATRFNFIHVYGQVSPFHEEEQYTIQSQMARNHPIWDAVDIARSGIKPYISTVACSINDVERPDGARTWMEALADWTLGSQFTLNGTLTCLGIQSPIAEGDNIEFDSVAFHIESISHSGSISPDGIKTFRTTLTLTNGMPVDQKNASVNFPRYPGFGGGMTNFSSGDQTPEDAGNDSFATALNPGMTVDNK